MSKILVGRKEEISILQEALQSDEAEMVSVIGRRRVGKTFLIKTIYKEVIDFELTGLQDAPRSEQLRNFAFQLNKFAKPSIPTKPPSDWLDAFMTLITYLETKQKKEKLVIFLDELSWMATHKSGFLRGLSFFWNSWATNQQIVVVICGSAASWMIQKVVNHRGGLHNRITKRIRLEPFTLAETEAYLKGRKVFYDRYQIVLLYMAMGGIPHYLKEVKSARSAIQNIEQICFSKKGLLQDEFSRLYPALFANAEKHMEVIKVLSAYKSGITRPMLAQKLTFKEGGTLKKILEELAYSGFIDTYRPYGKKKKEQLYRLTDEYSLFYLKFIVDNIHEGKDSWQQLSQTQIFKTWSGYAFENICFKHIPQIKKTLGISGVYSQSSSFYKKGTATQKGTQIDLLIDRNDHVINLIEVKFYNETFVLSKQYAAELREKMGVFRRTTATKKYLTWVLLTTFGVNHNQHSLGLVQNVLTLDDLFEVDQN